MMPTEYENLAALKAMEGKDLGTGPWLEVTQEMVNQFATATLDQQWIHTDVERARAESPYGGPIAHGMLTLSLIPDLFRGIVKVKSLKTGINYGCDKVRFMSVVPVGQRVRLQVTLTECKDMRKLGVRLSLAATVELEHAKKPACTAELIWIYQE